MRRRNKETDQKKALKLDAMKAIRYAWNGLEDLDRKYVAGLERRIAQATERTRNGL